MIYTSSFKSLGRLGDCCQLAVSNGLPTWYSGGRYKKLAPPHNLVLLLKETLKQNNGILSKEDIALFSRTYYYEVLDKLDPNEVYNDLLRIGNGKSVVLLSQEAEGEYSFRYVIKVWFSKAGLQCEEI